MSLVPSLSFLPILKNRRRIVLRSAVWLVFGSEWGKLKWAKKPRIWLSNTKRTERGYSIYQRYLLKTDDGHVVWIQNLHICHCKVFLCDGRGNSDALVEMGGSWCLVSFATQMKPFKWHLKGKLFWLISLSFFPSSFESLKQSERLICQTQLGQLGSTKHCKLSPQDTKPEVRHTLTHINWLAVSPLL